MIEEQPELETRLSSNTFIYIAVRVGVALCVIVLLCIAYLYMLGRPAASFPTDSTITIDPGESVSAIVTAFKDAGYVRSADLLYAYLVLEHDATDIRAGLYAFDDAISTRGVARVITVVGPSEPLLSITFPEGITVSEFAQIAEQKLVAFDKAAFLSYATEYEGFLFPDTYFVPDTYTDEDLFELLRSTSVEKLIILQQQIEESNLSEEEIIILASIIEREANTAESKKLVASVLLNRIEINMPLQADASIEYVLDKPLKELTPGDLKIDSPYNTYLNLGLPPTPIGNPGLDAIRAVLEPEPSDYFYYITDADGVFHYAKTFNEHRANIARFLR